jgi:hypothetical protein
VVFAVVLVLAVVYAWYYLTRPFASASGTFNIDSSWDGSAPFNVVWLEVGDLTNETAPLSRFAVLSFNPTLQRFTVIDLPLDYKIDLPSQGVQRLGAVYGIGNLADPKVGTELAAKSASYLLGIPVNGYFLVGSDGIDRLSQLFGSPDNLKSYFLLKNVTRLPKTMVLAHEFLKTNLSLKELLQVAYFVGRVRSDKVEDFSVEPRYLDDPKSLDWRMSSYFADKRISDARLKVQILNGTAKSGLASFAARIVRNMGAEVVRAGNYDQQDVTRGFLVLNESGSYTARRLAQVFGVADSRPPRSSTEKRADITVILGLENYTKIF